MKDAINQQQSLQNKIREPKDNFDRLLEHEDIYSDQLSNPFYQQPSAPKYNKFLAKKSRLKRANTIDIPNYLKVHTETNGCISLRRPIDISDKVLTNGASVIPSFQPKTENDRKFLALINKNNDTAPPATSVPFKNFSYRKNSTADKNWNNRFSNIKTAFDKQDQQDEKTDSKKKSIENEIVGSLKLFYGPTKKSNGFTHAPTSPFQKIEKLPKMDPPAFLKPGYIPSGSNLQAKVKIFDQEQSPKSPPPPPRTKLTRNVFHDDDITDNGHINYQTFCKQFAPKGTNHLEKTRSKFTGDDVKNIAKSPFVSHENGPFQKSKQKLLKMQQEEGYEPQKHYPKQYEIYPVNINPSIANIGHRYDHRSSEQKTRNPKRFEKTDDNRRRAFNKFYNEPDRSSVGVQTGIESYQDKNRFVNPEVRRKSNHASVQTSELYDNYKKNFHYPESQVYYSDRRNSSETPTTSPETKFENFRVENRMQKEPKSKMLPDLPMVDPVKTDIVKTRIADSKTVEPLRIFTNLPKVASDSSKLSIDTTSLSNSSNLPMDTRQYIGLLDTSWPIEQTGPPVPERTNYNNVLLRNYKSDQTRSKSSYYDQDDNPVFVPPIPVRSNSFDKIRHYEEDNKPTEGEFPNSEHIENQDISSDGVVTRYASAIATVASMPYVEPQKPKVPPYPEKLVDNEATLDEIQRHNQLQQNLSRRIQENAKSPTISQEIQPRQEPPRIPYEQERRDSKSPMSPSFIFGNKATLRHGSDSDSRRTQEKISMFEEINHPPVKRHFRPLNVPRTELHPPRINVVNPSKVIQPKFKIDRSPIVSSVSPVDSSDEYLMSCANKPSRNIVLTKSESWHQLAMARNTLQVPPTTSTALLKPPKPKSPSSLRLSKQFEASSSSDNIKKMEERIQRYFQGSACGEAKKETKNKRTMSMKKNSNSLMRSHTMPHLYDDKGFDESTDVEKAFDSLFKETTRTDNRY
ncbi:uncharacterized protein LOC122502129 [Leptopilina heterotoma]|uniref:uncharacterized protein LOC122502129 n=1 Tax=Leptopilina heterotoma TaxID=63436 RepID=UPI001CA8F7B4|nr:uncharacterized protein LOC122502129 [Leptopilina heterotoma]